jgi:hypothetical protein
MKPKNRRFRQFLNIKVRWRNSGMDSCQWVNPICLQYEDETYKQTPELCLPRTLQNLSSFREWSVEIPGHCHGFLLSLKSPVKNHGRNTKTAFTEIIVLSLDIDAKLTTWSNSGYRCRVLMIWYKHMSKCCWFMIYVKDRFSATAAYIYFTAKVWKSSFTFNTQHQITDSSSPTHMLRDTSVVMYLVTGWTDRRPEVYSRIFFFASSLKLAMWFISLLFNANPNHFSRE